VNVFSTLQDAARRIKHDTMVVYFAARDPRTPLSVRLLALAVAAYALSPIDLIPDFIPVLGYLDDLIILPALIALTIHFIPKDTFERYRLEAQGMWQDDKPKKWFYAIPFIIIWMLCAWLIARKFFPAG